MTIAEVLKLLTQHCSPIEEITREVSLKKDHEETLTDPIIERTVNILRDSINREADPMEAQGDTEVEALVEEDPTKLSEVEIEKTPMKDDLSRLKRV